MTYLSICSGIEAASVAWHPIGWQPLAFAEIEPFPSAVLAHHWPDVPNLGDMTKHHDWPSSLRPDLIVGGTPCQAFSVAGLRKGLEDPRGNLTLVFLGLLAQFRPTWVVWENVPGVLSDRTGAFGSFLGGLGQLGYGFAYRVLDAQHFGVPQRRRRVFVVGHLGDWRRAAAVLFEPACLRGDSPPRRETREVSPTIPARSLGGGGLGTLRAREQDSHENLAVAFERRMVRTTGGQPQEELAHCLRSDTNTGDGTPCVAFAQNTRDEVREMAVVGALAAEPGMKQISYLRLGTAVRRLTPTECERLQGFPDSHTLIPWRGKPSDQCPDGPRYKALGNSMAVPVMRWIGRRIHSLSPPPAKP